MTSRAKMSRSKGNGKSSASSIAAGRLCLRGAGRFESGRNEALVLEAKDALILAYLALEGPTPRSRLASLLWPDVDDERARANLRQRLLRLRRAAGVDMVEGNPQAALAPGIAHDLGDAVELLSAIEPHAVPGFAGWIEAQRARLARRRIDALTADAEKAEANGDLDAALEHAHALVEAEPLSEHAHRRLMRLHYLRGDNSSALAAYERCRDALRRDLHSGPSRETEALLATIKASASPVARTSQRTPPPVLARPPRLVGRDQEWQRMRSAWAQDCAFLLVGEPGIGKTRLLADFVQAQPDEKADFVACLAQCRPGDATVPFASVLRLLGKLAPETPPALPDGVDASARLVDLPRAQRAIADARARGVSAIVIDDLHFADDASLELLQSLCTEAEAPALRWGFAKRRAEGSPAVDALVDALAEARRVDAIDVAPLDRDAMRALVESLGIEELDAEALAEPLLRHTGGNPLYALETLKQMTIAPAENRLPRPANIGALIERRVQRLGPAALALARAAALAGPDFSAALAERVLQTPALALADAWSELEAAQVLKGSAFAHDLVYEAVLRTVPSSIASHTHAAIANFLAEHGGEPARIAAHRLAAGESLRAVDAFEEAGKRCQDAARLIEAGRHYRTAAEIAAGAGIAPDRVFALFYQAALTHWLTASAAEFAAFIEPLREWARSDNEHARYWIAKAHLAEKCGDWETQAAATERAIAASVSAGDQSLEATCRMTMGVVQANQGDYEKALHQFAAAIDALHATGARDAEAAARNNLGSLLSRMCRFDEANRQLELALPGLAEFRITAYLIANCNTRSGNALIQGDARRAAALAEQARALSVSGEAQSSVRAVAVQRQVEALRRLGRYRDALDAYGNAAAEHAGDPEPDVAALALAAVPVYMDLGRPDRALALLSAFEGQANVQRIDTELAALLRAKLAANPDDMAAAARSADPARMASPPRRCAFAAHVARYIGMTEGRRLVNDALKVGRELGLDAYLAELWIASAELSISDADERAAATACDRAARALADFDADGYRPALLLRLFRVEAQLQRHDRQRALLREAVNFIRHAEYAHVPPEFRESFLTRNDANREVLATARRQGFADGSAP